MELRVASAAAQLRRHADFAGATASGVCLIHCLLTPAVISIFPGMLPYLPGDVWFHRALSLGIILLGVAAFVPGYNIHRRKPLLFLVALGVACILAVAWSGKRLSAPTELALSIPGSLLLVTAHLLNRSFCRQCISCNTSDTCKTTDIAN